MADKKVDSADVLALRAEDKTGAEIARLTGISRQRVHQILSKTDPNEDLTPAPPPPSPKKEGNKERIDCNAE